MSQNLIHATLSPEDRQAILGALDAIEARLPFLHGLTPEERRSLPRMGDGTVGFVHAARRAAEQNPGLLPARSPVTDLAEDQALIESLSPVADRVARLHSLVQDTLKAAGSDAYAGALDIYAILQRTGSGEGLDALRQQLGQRFRRNRRPAGPNGPNGTPPTPPA